MLASLIKKLEDKERDWRVSFGDDISTPEARKRTLRHYRWFDHSFLRVWWHNFNRLSDEAYRSNQPSPKRMEYYKSIGIRTILNLRGVSPFSNYLFENEACEKLDLNLVSYHLSADKLPTREMIQDVVKTFDTVEKPFLLHCKSGADRAGFVSVLYMALVVGQPIEVAQKQLHWRYLHFKKFSKGILDFFFDEYRRVNARQAISLQDWIATQYSAEELTARYNDMRASGRKS